MLMVMAVCALPIAAVLVGTLWQLSALRRMEDKIDRLQELCKPMKAPPRNDGGAA